MDKSEKKQKRKQRESILVLCAHSDDQILGLGGTLAKYSDEGKRIFIIIFSYGEKSHPWLKKKVTVKMRVKESQAAGKVIGAEKTIFMGLEEGKFSEDIDNKGIHEKIKRLIEDYRPVKIFTHSADDPMPDHTAINKFTIDLCNEISYAGDVYAFDVWTPLKIKERNLPKVYIDITKTFSKKIAALKCFESQWMSMISLLWSVYYRAVKNGFRSRCRYAEVFYKIR
jgi:LmbE family N-acetylglucosaminyl deacetylase